jgi:hypothetical protein
MAEKSLKKHKTKAASDSDEDVGCMALLKKISCTLQCGGSTCSIKETEHTSGSNTPSVSPTVSMESLPVIKAQQSPELVSMTQENLEQIPGPTPVQKKRKRSTKKQEVVQKPNDEGDPPAPVVKKVRRTSRKKQEPVALQQEDNKTHAQ